MASFSTVATNGTQALTRSKHDLTTTSTARQTVMELEFIFHHETYHALQQMKRLSIKPQHVLDIFREECGADAYASIRLMESYGDEAVDLLKSVADLRISTIRDAVHLTTFTMDRAILIGSGLKNLDDSYDIDGDFMFDMAEKAANKDELFALMMTLTLQQCIDIFDGLDAMSTGMGNMDGCPDWVIDRYMLADRNTGLKLDFIQEAPETADDLPSLKNGVPMFRR